jgi:hypothetical protein
MQGTAFDDCNRTRDQDVLLLDDVGGVSGSRPRAEDDCDPSGARRPAPNYRLVKLLGVQRSAIQVYLISFKSVSAHLSSASPWTSLARMIPFLSRT